MKRRFGTNVHLASQEFLSYKLQNHCMKQRIFWSIHSYNIAKKTMLSIYMHSLYLHIINITVSLSLELILSTSRCYRQVISTKQDKCHEQVHTHNKLP